MLTSIELIGQLQALQFYLLGGGLVLFLLLETFVPLAAVPAALGRVRHLARNLSCG